MTPSDPAERCALPSRTLLIVASLPEAAAALRTAAPATPLTTWQPKPLWPGCDLLVCGIGKANAAGATALTLAGSPYTTVLSVGIAGALPGSDLQLGDAVAATACVYADEGLQSPAGFLDCAALGFPIGPFEGSVIPTDPALLELLRPFVNATGPIATVSTCSGADALAACIRARTNALAEAMEGAAVAHVAARMTSLRPDQPIAAGELRVISNTTGDRGAQQWDLKRALARLTEVLGRLREALPGSGR